MFDGASELTEREIELYRRGPHRFKILAYITRFYGPLDDAAFRDFMSEGDVEVKHVPNVPRGYACDTSLLLQFGTGEGSFFRMPIHFGDGKLHSTFEAAQEAILEECGVLVEPIPESELPTDFPRTGCVWIRVGRFVREYDETGRSREEIEADNELNYPVPFRGWQAAEQPPRGIVIEMKKPTSKPN